MHWKATDLDGKKLAFGRQDLEVSVYGGRHTARRSRRRI